MAAASPAAVMPMPPAFMRNAHEVVRADLNKVAAPALAVGEVARFKKAFEDLNRFMHTHGAWARAAATAAWRAAGRPRELTSHIHILCPPHLAGIMEDGRGDLPGFFKLLNDHSSGAVTAAGLPDEHVKLDAAADAVTAALAGNGDVAAAFAHYKDVCEAHLKHEEDVSWCARRAGGSLTGQAHTASRTRAQPTVDPSPLSPLPARRS